MRTRTSLIATLIALAIAAVTVPLATASPDRTNRLTIGIDLDFDSSAHATGTFAACCAVNDHGPAVAQILSYVPNADENQATFKATNTYTGQNGAFTILLDGVTGPLSSHVHIARADWRVIGGTGAYTGLHGDGRLTAVTDDTNGSLTGVATGEAHPAQPSRSSR
jgi:hypothetical protein